jgi:acyl carrier protein
MKIAIILMSCMLFSCATVKTTPTVALPRDTADDLDIVEFTMEVEEKFGVYLPDSLIEDVTDGKKSFRDLIYYINQYRKNKGDKK